VRYDRQSRRGPALPGHQPALRARRILLTINQPYKHWPKIFNNDSPLTSAVLDRLLHHDEPVIIEGKSYRMKDQIETP
jgi:DNA replication protein DnaC